jgi:serpin B
MGVLASAALLVACRDKPPSSLPPASIALVRPVADSTVALSLTLLRGKPENLTFSPSSVLTALGMAWGGARGQTATEMSRVLGYGPTSHDAFAVLSPYLTQRGMGVSIANRVFVDRRIELSPSFKDLTRTAYRADTVSLDFTDAKAVEVVNGWVDEQTDGKITKLLPSLTPEDRLVLINAILFKGAWQTAFQKGETRPEPFFTGLTPHTTPFMHHTFEATEARYVQDAEVQVLELPFRGSPLRLYVVLPRERGGLDGVLEHLTTAKVSGWFTSTRATKVAVALPRFRLSSTLALHETLRRAGLELPFTEGADFSGLGKVDTEHFFISQVIQQAIVKVDEEGAEAVAATAVEFAGSESKEPGPPVFRADHPFAFFIRDGDTGVVLFAGKVHRPEG